MVVWYKTKMEELPESCAKCSFQWCRLPCKNNSYEPIIKKKYMTQRHESCPIGNKRRLSGV